MKFIIVFGIRFMRENFQNIFERLKKAGFNNIRRAYFNDSSHKIFQDVEEYTRWENCLGIEAIK